jgi:hypothetical protein
MELTDRAFWVNYWESKTEVVQIVSKRSPFSKLFNATFQNSNLNTALEIGGFPGYVSIALNKHYGVKQADLLDYFIHPKIIQDLCEANEIKDGAINAIEADLFKEYTGPKYELVHSHGLIEHFENSENIIGQHLKFLTQEGQLLITLPNFRGINGWFQRNFDKDNYDKHYIPCMDIEHLKKCSIALGLKEVEVQYYGEFSMWLENMNTKSASFKLFFKATWAFFKVINKIVPIRNKTLSPYLIITAKQ